MLYIEGFIWYVINYRICCIIEDYIVYHNYMVYFCSSIKGYMYVIS